MAQISLATYTIRLRDKKSKNFLPLNDFDGNDLYDFVNEYFELLSKENINKDDVSQTIFIIDKVDKKEGERTFHGIIKTGGYGFESDIVDSENGKLKYRRELKDAEVLPFYFLLHFPLDKDEGFLILQRFGVHGISTDLPPKN